MKTWKLTKSVPAADINGVNKNKSMPSAYSIPMMTDIRNLPSNHRTVVSLFAGAGGSSTGYRLAGYRVIWANEIDDIAADSYKSNYSDTQVVIKTIREVNPNNIEIEPRSLDILDGSPPCQSFSMAGNREKDWNKIKNYSGHIQRNDDLFYEYIRFVKVLQPKVIVAENVKGLVIGKAKGYFLNILKALKDCGYNVKVKLLDAQWLGVPQRRVRTIFIGIRNDLNLEPVFPKPLSYQYTIRDAFAGLNDATVGKLGKTYQSLDTVSNTVSAQLAYNAKTNSQGFELIRVSGKRNSFQSINKIADTITTNGSRSTVNAQYNGADFLKSREGEVRRLTIPEVKRLCSFPDDYILKGNYADQWRQLGNSVPPMMMFHIADTLQKHCFPDSF